MAANGTGTSGGWRGMNVAQRRISLGAGALFLAVVILIMIANAESAISDLAASGARVRADLVWSWQWTSMIGWLSIYPLLWIAVARLRPPRFSWASIITALIVGALVASGLHIAVMIALRHIYYAASGSGPYHFFGIVPNRLMYEFRKDVPTYLQFVVIAATVQWLLARAAGPAAEAPRTMTVSDGAVTHHVPLAEIESVTSAGNYVAIEWGSRTLLQRATLATTASELGDPFVRVHRGLLVRRDAIRRVVTDKSGDFTLTLASGAEVRGSRRYRAGLNSSC